MTRSQRNVFNAILRFVERTGISPTTREICEEAGLASTATVCKHLHTLEKQGFISILHGRARAIRVTACEVDGRVA